MQLVILQLLLIASLSDAADMMPSIGSLFRGYDIMLGNPLPTQGVLMDPGFRQPIFNASYLSGSMTPDQRYLQPDGTSVQKCAGCSLSFDTHEIGGTHEYQKALSVKASVSGEGWGAKFSGSADYKKVQTQSDEENMVMTHSEALCCAYTASLLTYEPPALHSNFVAGVKQLPQTYNAVDYQRFISTFGTHYVTTINMGAVFGQQSTFTRESWSHMLEGGLDTSAAASYSGFGISAAGSTETDSRKQTAQTFNEASTQQSIYSIGAKPPPDASETTWTQETVTTPAPITIELAQVDALLELPELKGISPRIKTNLQKALEEYCEQLQQEGHVTSCAAPGPDTPFPTADYPLVQMKQLMDTLSNIKLPFSSTFARCIYGNSWNVLATVASTIRGMSAYTTFPVMMRMFLGSLSSLSTFGIMENPFSGADKWEGIRKKSQQLSKSSPVDQFCGIVKLFANSADLRSDIDQLSTLRSTLDIDQLSTLLSPVDIDQLSTLRSTLNSIASEPACRGNLLV